MPARRRPLIAVAIALAALAAAAVSGSPVAAPVRAASPNRAGLVIDTGTEVKKLCVTFDEEAISGAEVLRRADVDAVFASYSGQGSAVCSLCHTGCPADDCLTCDPDGRYWSYHRAPWGASSYQYSRAGAGSTEVRDGDVEGWAWGTGRAPPYFSFAELCGDPAPTRSTDDGGGTAGSGGGSDGSGGSDPSADGQEEASPVDDTAPAPAPSPSEPPPTTSTAGEPEASTSAEDDEGDNQATSSVTSTTVRADERPERRRSSSEAAPAPAASEAEKAPSAGGSPAGTLAAVAVAGGLLGWAVRLRRRRRPRAGGGGSDPEHL